MGSGFEHSSFKQECSVSYLEEISMATRLVYTNMIGTFIPQKVVATSNQIAAFKSS